MSVVFSQSIFSPYCWFPMKMLLTGRSCTFIQLCISSQGSAYIKNCCNYKGNIQTLLWGKAGDMLKRRKPYSMLHPMYKLCKTIQFLISGLGFFLFFKQKYMYYMDQLFFHSNGILYPKQLPQEIIDQTVLRPTKQQTNVLKNMNCS